MNKTLLIARSEYGRRVRSKWFVATTLLAPLFALAVLVIPVVVVGLSDDGGPSRIAVQDRTGRLAGPVDDALDGTALEAVDGPVDTLRARVLRGDVDGALFLPAELLDDTTAMGADGPPPGAVYYSKGGLSAPAAVRSAVRDAVRAERARLAGASDALVERIEAPVPFDPVTVSEDGDTSGGAIGQFIVANTLSLLIYLAILIYGAMVMRGVIEEKANRIVEVVASSVRPFELMMGKVLGIGAVGLTQLVGWGVLMLALGAAAGPLLLAFGGAPDPAAFAAAAPADELPFDPADLGSLVSPGLIVAFVLFFVGGYLLFAGLFAAVGSAVDQEADAQSLQVPIILPVMIPLLFLTYVADSPDAPLSVFLSLFPASSPVLMVVRMTVTDVPVWQVALALLLLAAAFVGVIWLAARIYRVGILMYGKKATLRDLWAWLRTA